MVCHANDRIMFFASTFCKKMQKKIHKVASAFYIDLQSGLQPCWPQAIHYSNTYSFVSLITDLHWFHLYHYEAAREALYAL